MNDLTYMREVNEAIQAGERAIRSLREARAKLDSAGNWGILDILSNGGFISGLIKHSKMSDAQQLINQAKWDLTRFEDELRDVQDLGYLNVEIGGFLTFADFFFDGLLADIMVQSKISEAKHQVDDAIYRVERIVNQLRASR